MKIRGTQLWLAVLGVVLAGATSASAMAEVAWDIRHARRPATPPSEMITIAATAQAIARRGTPTRWRVVVTDWRRRSDAR